MLTPRRGGARKKLSRSTPCASAHGREVVFGHGRHTERACYLSVVGEPGGADEWSVAEGGEEGVEGNARRRRGGDEAAAISRLSLCARLRSRKLLGAHHSLAG